MDNGLLTFLKTNAWGLVTALTLGAMNYGIVVTRLEAVEKKLSEHELALQQLASVRTMDYRLSMIDERLKNLDEKIVSYDENIQRFYKDDWAKVQTAIKALEVMYSESSKSVALHKKK